MAEKNDITESSEFEDEFALYRVAQVCCLTIVLPLPPF